MEAVIPNPRELRYILKNDPVNFYFILRPGFEGEYFSVKCAFTDPTTGKTEVQELVQNVREVSMFEFLDKKAQHKKLELVLRGMKGKEKEKGVGDILMAKPGAVKEWVVKESVRHQVLCSETAFVCVERGVGDEKLQEVKGARAMRITVPQYGEEKAKGKERGLEEKKEKLKEMKSKRGVQKPQQDRQQYVKPPRKEDPPISTLGGVEISPRCHIKESKGSSAKIVAPSAPSRRLEER